MDQALSPSLLNSSGSMLGEEMTTIWKLGKPWRVWPFAGSDQLLVSVATGRPRGSKKCTLFSSTDGLEFRQIADFGECDPKASTTGQPFINSRGTIFVPVWDVDYYHVGATYTAIHRSDDNGETWTKVYEDSVGTYANHFFESPDRKHLFIGIGRRGGGKDGVIKFSPASGYLLHSNDDGRSWSTFLEFEKPSALYQGMVLEDDSIVVTTREQKSLIRASLYSQTWREEPLNHTSRCITYVPEMKKFVISSDSAILVSDDTKDWSPIKAPVIGALRYPVFHDGLIHLACSGLPHSVIATDLKHWYMVKDFSRLTKTPITRMAFFRDAFYNGSEFEGHFAQSSAHAIRRKLGFLDSIPPKMSKWWKSRVWSLRHRGLLPKADQNI